MMKQTNSSPFYCVENVSIGKILASIVTWTVVLLITGSTARTKSVSLSIEDAMVGQRIPSTMHGVILETNINRGDDGGLYAELIYNRAFQEKGRSLDGWSAYGEAAISLDTNRPLSDALPAHLKFSLHSSSSSPSGFTNGGFYGINVQAQKYNASFFFRPSAETSITGNAIKIGLRDAKTGKTYGESRVDMSSAAADRWSQFSAIIHVPDAAPTDNNTFFLEFPPGTSGEFTFNLLSCFPPTYKDRTNGVRRDIAEAFATLQPGFVRLPGGNDLEGHAIAERFIWNNTIGPLENRPGRKGTWTGYNTEGFGLLELLTFTEDIGAQVLLAVYAGYSLYDKSVPKDELQPYIDEVINELDFLMAPAASNPMGALRARLGRPEPFQVNYVEIGNEDFLGTALITYHYRWTAFYEALSQRYPKITFIATTDLDINPPPVIDEHHYRGPLFYIENFRRYETLPRTGPKVLVGEFSVENDDDLSSTTAADEFGRLRYPTIKAAVAETVHRIAFERNSDIVIGGCYAPVLQNVADAQWTPNFILFNVSATVKSTSYLAQQMFGQHLGTIVLNSTARDGSNMHQSIRKGEEGDGKLGHLYFVSTKNTTSSTIIVKFASVDTSDIVVNAQIDGSTVARNGTVFTLSAGVGVDPSTVANTLSNPNAASIVTTQIHVINGTWSVTVPSWSVVVVQIAV